MSPGESQWIPQAGQSPDKDRGLTISKSIHQMVERQEEQP